jgi:hypothetical protein
MPDAPGDFEAEREAFKWRWGRYPNADDIAKANDSMLDAILDGRPNPRPAIRHSLED